MTKQIFISKPFQILGLLSLISLVYIFYYLKNPSTSIKTSISPSPTPSFNIKPNQPIFNNIKSYNVNLNFDLDLPESLPVYEAQPTTEDLNNIIQKLVTDFKLEEDPTNKSRWLSTDKTQYLYIDYKNQSIHYAKYPKNRKFSQRLNQDLAVKTAQKFYQDHFPTLSFDSKPSFIANIYVPSTGRDASASTQDRANYYTISFNYQVNNLPYYQGANLQDALNISVTYDNTVAKFTYHSQSLPTLSNPQNLPLINKDKIIQLLESGAGEVAYADALDIPNQNIQFPDVTLGKYDLEYRFNETKKMVIPYFRFYGTFMSPFTQKTAYITLILPAVEL